MTISICKRFKFDAAHHLPYYDGKCKQNHGHSFKLDVEVSGQIQDQGYKTGMIIDFHDLKDIVNLVIINVLDHTDLNAHISNPTAENMIEMFSRFLQDEFSHNPSTPGIVLERLRLYETEDSYAEWRQ